MAEIHNNSKTILITGCSSGIGQLCAQRFAELGWNVVATARDESALVAFQSPANVLPCRLDVTDQKTIDATIKAAKEKFNRIDVLVNNAGYGVYGPLEGVSAEQLEGQFKTNVFGMAAMIRSVLPAMRAQRSGVIVNISSIGGRIAAPFGTPYYASKFAVEGLSEALRYELDVFGIRVKLVEPAHFKTDFFRRSLQLARHPAYEAELNNYNAWMLRADETAEGPEAIVKAVIKAATDSSHRLRYPVKARVPLFLRAFFPDALLRSFLTMGLRRAPPSRTKKPRADTPAARSNK